MCIECVFFRIYECKYVIFGWKYVWMCIFSRKLVLVYCTCAVCVCVCVFLVFFFGLCVRMVRYFPNTYSLSFLPLFWLFRHICRLMSFVACGQKFRNNCNFLSAQCFFRSYMGETQAELFWGRREKGVARHNGSSQYVRWCYSLCAETASIRYAERNWVWLIWFDLPIPSQSRCLWVQFSLLLLWSLRSTCQTKIKISSLFGSLAYREWAVDESCQFFVFLPFHTLIDIERGVGK